MHEKKWEWTILDRVHDGSVAAARLGDDEYPIVSFFADASDWTLMTTHRVIGSVDGLRTEIGRDDLGATDFGDFKQDLDSPRIVSAEIEVKGVRRTFLYESGYASMAPIYCLRFWSVKWPVLRETYRLSMPGSPEVPSPGGDG